MATVKQVVGARTALTTSALNSLASATFVSAGSLTHNTNQPLDVLLEVTATPGTVSGNKQLLVYAKASLDGSNQTTGPETGTAVTDEPNLYFVGALPLNTNSTTQTRIFSLAAAYGGVLPYASEIVVRNDSGAALNASGGSVYYSEISATVA
jgi:hypothetical protein